MVSALYIVLGALLLIKLSIDIVKLRIQYQVHAGDGGFYDLQTAIRMHSNALECIPIACLMLLMMEMNGAEVWMIHLCGIMLFAGRAIHYFWLYRRELSWTRSGMGATYVALLLMAAINLYYLPWEQLFVFYWFDDYLLGTH